MGLRLNARIMSVMCFFLKKKGNHDIRSLKNLASLEHKTFYKFIEPKCIWNIIVFIEHLFLNEPKSIWNIID